MKKKTRSSIEKFIIRPADRYEIMWTHIEKGKDEYDFYDVKYGDVIIKGCSVVEGKKGAFLGMPSKERDGSYYPVVFLSRGLGKRLITFIEEADENDDWEETDLDYLSFDDDSDDSKSERKRSKKRSKEKSDAEEDDESE